MYKLNNINLFFKPYIFFQLKLRNTNTAIANLSFGYLLIVYKSFSNYDSFMGLLLLANQEFYLLNYYNHR